jgi:hypothetical protein
MPLEPALAAVGGVAPAPAGSATWAAAPLAGVLGLFDVPAHVEGRLPEWAPAQGGSDVLVGGSGDDLLVGHEGADYLVGGVGSDRGAPGEDEALLADFDLGVGPGRVDEVWLSPGEAAGGVAPWGAASVDRLFSADADDLGGSPPAP